jgi:hypothetical protein
MPDGGAPGVGVDAAGNPVRDPTANVLDLVDAAVKRLDDLREQDRQHGLEKADLRHMYEKELREAESARIDAIRAVDVAAVQRASDVAGVTAETLRANVAATAAAAATALATALEPILKSIADLQRAQYETQGGKAQTSETRLNYGTVIGGVGVLLAIMAIVVAVIIGTRH